MVPEFPTTPVLDDFARPDGALGANWSAEPFNDGSSGFTIISAAAQVAGPTLSGNAAWYNLATAPPDQEAWIDLPTFWGVGIGEAGIFLRVANPSASSSTGDGYQVFITATGGGPVYSVDLSYFRWDNGVETQIGATQTGIEFTEGWSFGARIIGSELQAFAGPAGNLVRFGAPETDSTYTDPGYVGFSLYEDARRAVVSNFGGGAIVSIGWPASEYLGMPGSSRKPMPMFRGPARDRIMGIQLLTGGARRVVAVERGDQARLNQGPDASPFYEAVTPGGADAATGTEPGVAISVDAGGVDSAAGTEPGIAVAVSPGGALGDGVTPTEVIGGGGVSETPTPGGAAASGTGMGAAVPPTAAASAGGGTGAPASVGIAPGNAAAAGTGPAAQATTAPAAAVGSGAAPNPAIAATPAASAGAGTGPPARVDVSPGAALGAGPAPTDSTATSETPTPGGAVGSGTGLSARATATTGASAGSGTGATPRAAAPSGGGSGAGTAPTAGIGAGQAGGAGGGTAGSASAGLSPGGGSGAGSAPSPWITVSAGGAIVAANLTTGAVVTITAGGATAGGTPPDDGLEIIPAVVVGASSVATAVHGALAGRGSVTGASAPLAELAGASGVRTAVAGAADELVHVTGGVSI